MNEYWKRRPLHKLLALFMAAVMLLSAVPFTAATDVPDHECYDSNGNGVCDYPGCTNTVPTTPDDSGDAVTPDDGTCAHDNTTDWFVYQGNGTHSTRTCNDCGEVFGSAACTSSGAISNDICDWCGATIDSSDSSEPSEPEDPELPVLPSDHDCCDENGDGLCDLCDADMGTADPELPAVPFDHTCYDDDGNDKCDEAGCAHNHYFRSDPDYHYYGCTDCDLIITEEPHSYDHDNYSSYCSDLHWVDGVCECGHMLSSKKEACTDSDGDLICDFCGDELYNEHLAYDSYMSGWQTHTYFTTCSCGEKYSKGEEEACTDDDGDLYCDVCGQCMHPETEVQYQHNGLCAHEPYIACTNCGSRNSSTAASIVPCTDDEEDGLCDLCGGEYTEHKYKWVNDSTYHWQVCSICGLTEETSEHSVAPKYEPRCEDQHRVRQACECGYKDKNSSTTTENCTADGNVCSLCGDELANDHVIDERYSSSTYRNWQTHEHYRECDCGDIEEDITEACTDSDGDLLCDLCKNCIHPQDNITTTYIYSDAILGSHVQKHSCDLCGKTHSATIACTDLDTDDICDLCGHEIVTEVSGECGAEGDNLTWTFDVDGVLTISGKGKMMDYTSKTYAPWYNYKVQITQIVMDEGVSHIGSYAFANLYNVEQDLIFPSTVVSIGDYAFSSFDSEGQLQLNDGLEEIGAYAFRLADFEQEVILPDSIKVIGENAFFAFYGFGENFRLPANLEKLETGAFDGALTKKRIDGTVNITLGEHLCHVGGAAFGDCDIGTFTLSPKNKELYLENNILYNAKKTTLLCTLGDPAEYVTVPDTVTTIEDDAFYGTVLGGVLTLGSNVETIGEGAFYGTKLLAVYLKREPDTAYGLEEKSPSFPENITVFCDNLYDFTWDDGTSYSDATWKGYPLRKWDKNGTIIASGECGAEGDNLIWTLDTKGVLTISGEGAMEEDSPWSKYSSSIVSLVLEEGITTIAEETFCDLGNLTGTLTLPSTLTEIGNDAFSGCRNLIGDLVIPEGVTTIGGAAFENCGFDGTLTLPSTLSKISNSAFRGCTNFTGDLVIPEGVISIGTYAFRNCGFDGTLTLPSTLTVISDYAFADCTNFSGDLVIPEGVTAIGTRAFEGCGFDGTLTLPGTLTQIGDYAFYLCENLTGDLVIPEGVTAIGQRAFSNCAKLTGTVKLPLALKNVGINPFAKANKLTGIEIPEENILFTTRDGLLYDEDLTRLIAAPGGWKGTWQLPETVTAINSYAFYGVASLKGSLLIPEHVTTIASNAFRDCDSLRNVTIAADSVTIDTNAFYHCSYMDYVHFLGDAPHLGNSKAFSELVDESFYNATLFYHEGTSGWTDSAAYDEATSTWNGYPLRLWQEGEAIIMASGTCGAEGDNLTWTFDTEGVLTISGEGDMADYAAWDMPWEDYRSQITAIVLEEGMTSIGDRAFYNIYKATAPVVIPDSVTHVGNYAFVDYRGGITLGSGIETIGDWAFFGATLSDHIIPASMKTIGAYAFQATYPSYLHFMGDAPQIVTGENASFDEDVIFYYNEGTSGWTDSAAYDEAASTWNGYPLRLWQEDEEQIIASGNCGAEGDGSNITWKLTADGVLTISGEGEIADYEAKVYSAPWLSHWRSIKTVTLSEGITRIGDHAMALITGTVTLPMSLRDAGIGNTTSFVVAEDHPYLRVYNGILCTKDLTEVISAPRTLTQVQLPEEVTVIRPYAFYFCQQLTGELQLPEGLRTIGEYAFEGDYNLTGTLEIPDSVEEIGDSAFSDPRFDQVIIGKGLSKLGIKALDNSELRSFTVAEENEHFASFDDCLYTKDLTTLIRVPREKSGRLTFSKEIATVATDAAAHCRNLTGDLVIPDTVTAIESDAFDFAYRDGTKLIMGKNVTSLANNAFAGTAWDAYFPGNAPETKPFRDYGIPTENTVIHVPASNLPNWRSSEGYDYETGLWYGCMLQVWAKGNVIASGNCGTVGNGSNLRWQLQADGTLTITGKGKMADYESWDTPAPWEDYTSMITALSLGEGITYIGAGAFESINFKGSVIIPEGVISIGASAFRYASIQGTLTLPDTLRTVGEQAFYSCDMGEQLTIPAGVTSIGINAFSSNYGLRRVYFPGNAPTMAAAYTSDRAFDQRVTFYYNADATGWTDSAAYDTDLGTWNGYTLAVWDGSEYTVASGYCGADADGRNLTWTLTRDPRYTAFGICLVISGEGKMADFEDVTPWEEAMEELYGDVAFDAIFVEDGVTSIGKKAFQRIHSSSCTVYISDTVTHIGDSAFRNSNFHTISLGQGIETIGEYAFSGCEADTEVVIPGSVTSIGNFAFGVSEFPTITLEKGIKTIGESAFYNCYTGSDLVIPSTVTEIGAEAFRGSHFSSITLSKGIKAIGENAFRGCYATNALVIPDSVTEIGNFAFQQSRFSSITLGKGLKTIGAYAFANTSMSNKPVLPEGLVSIGDHAFEGNSFSGMILLPASLEQLGVAAFGSCSKVSMFMVAEGSEHFSSLNGVVLDKEQTTVICAPGGLNKLPQLPETVTKIGDYAFFGTRLSSENLTLPESIETVGEFAFYGCNLIGTLTLGSNVKKIGDSAFAGTWIEKVQFYGDAPEMQSFQSCHGGFGYCTFIYFPGTKGWTDSPYYDAAAQTWHGHPLVSAVTSGTCGEDVTWKLDPDGTLTISGSGDMEDYDYQRWSNSDGETWVESTAPWGQYAPILTKLVLEDGISSIGDHAFYGCSGFTGELILPETITEIGRAAFYGCSGFTGDLVIPDGVRSIEYETFRGCSGFDGTLKLGRSITSIGSYAFESCSGLTGTLTLPKKLTDLQSGAFKNCSGFTGSLVIPAGIRELNAEVFSGCTGFDGTLTLGEAVYRIEEHAFYDCENLTGQLVLPENLDIIGDAAFYGCKGLTGQLVLPEGLNSLGTAAFYGCQGFTGQLVLPSSLEELEHNTFFGCSGFTGDLIIPESVTYMGSAVFHGCTGLSGSVTIPADMTYMGKQAFAGCAITDFRFLGDAPAVLAADTTYPTFEPEAVLYCMEAAEGWLDSAYFDEAAGTWRGYALGLWDGENILGMTKPEEPEVPTIEKFDVAGSNMNLGNELALNFMFTKALDESKTYTAVITQTSGGKVVKTTTVEQKDWASFNSSLYKVTASVRSMDMADDLKLEIMDEDGNVYNNDYVTSVRDYAKKALAAASSSAKMKQLVVDMLRYGAAAQVNFGYLTNDLADSLLTPEQLALGGQTASCTDKRIKGDHYQGSNLALKDRIELNLFFKDVTTKMYAVISYTNFQGKQVSYTLPGENFVLYSGTTYKIPVDAIVLADASSLVTVTVHNADGSVFGTGADSVESYCARAGANDLNAAILTFAASAKAYLN